MVELDTWVCLVIGGISKLFLYEVPRAPLMVDGHVQQSGSATPDL